MTTVSPQVLDAIRPLGTSLVADAIETLSIRLANEGFIRSGVLTDLTPKLPPLLGYAVTARIRTVHPPMNGAVFAENNAWLRYIATLPEPRIVVLQDFDHSPGLGAFFGEMHAAVHQALGCIGVVTNGAVRDLQLLNKLGFHCYAGQVSVSRAYAHVTDFGVPVDIGGLMIKPGDLLYGDGNGVISIPLQNAELIPAAALIIQEKTHQTLELCTSGKFTLAEFEALTASLGYDLSGFSTHLDPELLKKLTKR